MQTLRGRRLPGIEWFRGVDKGLGLICQTWLVLYITFAGLHRAPCMRSINCSQAQRSFSCGHDSGRLLTVSPEGPFLS